MTIETLISLLKIKLGISSSVQDIRLKHLIEGVLSEMERIKGIEIDMDDPLHTDFITDYSEYRFKYVNAPMPVHLKIRYNQIFLKDSK